MLSPLHLLTGSKSIHIIFLLIVITFLPAFLNFLMTSLIVVTLTALFTMLILTATVSNFLTVLSLMQSFVSPHIQGHSLRYAPLSGWTRSAHTLKQSAQFWHKVWSDCGCPSSGVLFQIKKNSKRRFKYEVLRLRRRRNHIQHENLATAISYSNPQEFWKQVKKLSKPSSGAMSSSSIIDGCNNDIEISNIFASKLESLLNSVPDTTSRTSLQHRVKESITSSALSSVFITQEIVYDAISQLKSNKNDGSVLSSNHIIYAKDVLSTPLSKLFTAMIRHSTVPTLRDCILVSIPKPGKDQSCSDNYCPIALAPTLSKVFEWCLLFKFQSCFATSSLQFGFKPGFSSNLYTGLLKNVIHKYLVNNFMFMDAF